VQANLLVGIREAEEVATSSVKCGLLAMTGIERHDNGGEKVVVPTAAKQRVIKRRGKF